MKYFIPPELPPPTHVVSGLPKRKYRRTLKSRRLTQEDLVTLSLDDGMYQITRETGSSVKVVYKGNEWKSVKYNKFIVRLFLEVLALRKQLGGTVEPLAPITTITDPNTTNTDK